MNIRCMLIGLVLIGTPAQAFTIEKTTIRTTVDVPVSIVFPDRMNGKVPAVMLLHGTVGIIKSREWVYAEKFAAMGIASIIIDTFTPRGIKNTLANQSEVTAAQMADDAIAILQTVANHPKLDGDKISLMGFSKGGTAALRLSIAFFNKPGKKQFSSFIAMYPSCTDYRLDPQTTGKPILMILGEKDTWTNPETCADIARIQKERGANISAPILTGAKHGWDVPGSNHVENTKAENYSKCIFVEIKPSIWIESRSKIVVYNERGPQKEERERALKSCMTYGVSSGYNAKAAEKSWELIKGHLRVLTD